MKKQSGMLTEEQFVAVAKSIWRNSVPLDDRDEQVRSLLARHTSAGDRRDGMELDYIEAELYRLTGDARWAPYDPGDEE